MFKKLISIILTVFLFSCGTQPTKKQVAETESYDSYLVVGTYTQKDSKGINIYKFNTETGASIHVSETNVSNPSYLTISKNGNNIYAVSEDDETIAKLTSYRLDKKTGLLTEIDTVALGTAPCFVTVNNDNNTVLIAEYGAAAVKAFKLEDGDISSEKTYSFDGKSIHPQRQTKSYLHNIVFSPDERFAFANDLGADKIYKFSLENNDFELLKKEEITLKAGSGPRHTEFHPNGKFAYTITEISGDVLAFSYDASKGDLKEIQSIKQIHSMRRVVETYELLATVSTYMHPIGYKAMV